MATFIYITFFLCTILTEKRWEFDISTSSTFVIDQFIYFPLYMAIDISYFIKFLFIDP
jgi:hypothetical protein